MNTEKFRNLINLFESRIPDVEYEDVDTDRVVAKLKSYNSQVYTKLANKLLRLEELENEIKALKEELKGETKENIHDLFDAEDAARTRVIETVSFIFTLSKDPKVTESPKYKEILSELEKQLTPELILVLESLKKQLVTVTQKSPALRVRTIKEGVESIFARFKDSIMRWANRYDQKLAALKASVTK